MCRNGSLETEQGDLFGGVAQNSSRQKLDKRNNLNKNKKIIDMVAAVAILQRSEP